MKRVWSEVEVIFTIAYQHVLDIWNWILAWTLWRVVFWYKKQTGWLDLGQEIEITGTIVSTELNVEGFFNDGDICFNVKLDPGQDHWITGFGGVLTDEDKAGHTGPSIHCEITPWTRPKFDGKWQALAVGKRVRVRGWWGFDGVHLGGPEWLEVLRALWRHQPNVRQGWFELHGVTSIEFLE